MKKGYLSQYFSGAAAKSLSAVEVRPDKSRQHEFNGSTPLIELLGPAGHDARRYPARFLYVDETATEPVAEDLSVTWYDARAKSAERTGRSEHRLYFTTNVAMQRAREGDLLLIARRQDSGLLVILAEGGSTIAAQLHWLFCLPDRELPGFEVRAGFDSEQDRLGVATTLVLEQIGIEADLTDDVYLDAMLARFGDAFPPTRVFSTYARETLEGIDAEADPDAALTTWMDREEILFRTLEKHLLAGRLRSGFLRDDRPDVEGFLAFSLSVQNRRKARAGAALENHLGAVFTALDIQHERGATTERKNRPDFLFPGAGAYHNPAFEPARLTMLAAKTTAKDRWRQITKEADRIPLKHLLTLEPAISAAQTTQMRDSGVELIVPASIHAKYSPDQCLTLLSLRHFASLLRARQ
jgi:hypothetical protein